MRHSAKIPERRVKIIFILTREKRWYLWLASKLQELGCTWSFFYLGEDYFFALRVGMFDFLQRLGSFICFNDKSLTGSLLQLQAEVFSSIYCYEYVRLQPVSSTPLHFKDWDAGIRIRIRNRFSFLQGLEHRDGSLQVVWDLTPDLKGTMWNWNLDAVRLELNLSRTKFLSGQLKCTSQIWSQLKVFFFHFTTFQKVCKLEPTHRITGELPAKKEHLDFNWICHEQISYLTGHLRYIFHIWSQLKSSKSDCSIWI